jgi:membrane-associated phospholipid phosphatase
MTKRAGGGTSEPRVVSSRVRGQADPTSLDTVRTRQVLLGIAVLAIVLFVLLYTLAVHTHWGQRLDAAALEGRGLLSRHDVHVAARLHNWIDVASLTLLGGAVMLVALVRRRVRLAFGVGTIIVGSVATSELLKHTLSRPFLGVSDSIGSMPSYPSGHTSIAMSLSVGAVFVAPRRFRAPVAVLGVIFSAAMGCSLVATANHRPSDTVGAAFVVTAWSAAVAALLLRTDPAAARGRPALQTINPWMALGGIALLVASFGVAAITIVAGHYGRLQTVHFGRAFVAAGSAITGTILLCMAALLTALQDSELDPRARRARAP